MNDYFGIPLDISYLALRLAPYTTNIEPGAQSAQVNTQDNYFFSRN